MSRENARLKNAAEKKRPPLRGKKEERQQMRRRQIRRRHRRANSGKRTRQSRRMGGGRRENPSPIISIFGFDGKSALTKSKETGKRPPGRFPVLLTE